MSDIWLADLVRAIHALDPSRDELAHIVRMLGARPVEGPTAPRGPSRSVPAATAGRWAGPPLPGGPTHVVLPGPARVPEVPPAFAPRPDEPEPPPVRHGLRQSRLGAVLRGRFRQRAGRARPERGTADGALAPAGRQMPEEAPEVLSSLEPPDPGGLGRRPAHVPLLASRSTRAVLYHLLARRVPGGALDVDAAVAVLAEQQPPRRMARRPVRTLRFGAQVLVDRSDSMRLFARDQQDLVRVIRHLVGAATTDVRYFSGSPLRGVGTRPAGRRQRYAAPPSGTPVLLLSDFGTTGHPNCPPGASAPEWEAFFRQCGSADRPVALVPYRAENAPAWLRRACRLVTWDRSTTAHAVGTGVR